MIPEKQNRAMRRLRRRNAARRAQRLTAIRSDVESRTVARTGLRSSTYPSRLISEAARDDGTRRPTRQELQWREKFYYAARELGIG